MALSQPAPAEPEPPSPYGRRPLQESPPPGPAEPRSPQQESSSPGPAEPCSPPRDFPPAGSAEPRSPQQDSPSPGSAEPRSPQQDSPSPGSAEPRSPQQEPSPPGPSEPRSPQQDSRSPQQDSRSPQQDSPSPGPAEPLSPQQDSRSPPQVSPPAGPAELRSPQQDSRSPPRDSPSPGPSEPRSPQQDSRSPPRDSPSPGPSEPRSPQQDSRSPPRDSPSPGPAERPPSAAPGPARQLRVLLTPLPAAALPRPQKRRLSPRAPARKRLCPELDSGTGPGTGTGTGTGTGPGSAARRQDGPCDADSDVSDGVDAVPDGDSNLSAYERKRLKNITENAKFFASLKLHESAERLNQLTAKRQSHVTKRAKPKKVEAEAARRRSMRLLRVEPQDIPLLETPARPGAEENPQVPVGPLPMVPEDQAENSKWTEALLGTWMKINELEADDADRGTPDIKRYRESLSSMVLSEENIRKVVKGRVCSMAIHPSQSAILVAAGDKWGHVGLWNVSCRSEEGAHIFIPHSFHVNCMHFSPCNPAHLLSLSNDTLRCADVTRAVFDEICRSEEDFSCFDFLEQSASTAIVSHWGGAVALVDRRTGGSPELSADIGFRRTRTVHVHPVNKQYFLAAGSVDVCVFDVRYLKAKMNKPLSSLTGHTKSVASAYFSPVTGSRVVTVCADDKLRVYDTTSLSPTVTPLSSIRHNNNTGRWLTRFRAIWDPKQEHCFLVGSMAQPRQIQVFQDSGDLLHSLCNTDCLSSVCSIIVVHPSQSIVVGGNSSGRLHVFK